MVPMVSFADEQTVSEDVSINVEIDTSLVKNTDETPKETNVTEIELDLGADSAPIVDAETPKSPDIKKVIADAKAKKEELKKKKEAEKLRKRAEKEAKKKKREAEKLRKRAEKEALKKKREAEKLRKRAEKEAQKKKREADKAAKAALKKKREADKAAKAEIKKKREAEKLRKRAEKEALKKKREADKAAKLALKKKRAEAAALKKAQKEAQKKKREADKAAKLALKKKRAEEAAAKRAANEEKKKKRAAEKAARAIIQAKKKRDLDSRLFFDHKTRSGTKIDLGEGLSAVLAIGTGGSLNKNLDLNTADGNEIKSAQISGALIVKYEPHEDLTFFASASSNASTSQLNEDDLSNATGMALSKIRASYAFDNQKGALTIGRFAMSDRRTWIIASVFDAVHFRYRTDNWNSEIAVMRKIIDPKAYYAFAHYQNNFIENALTGVYAITERGSDEEKGNNQTNIGAYIEGKGGWDTEYWGNLGLSIGREEGDRNQGFALDFGISKKFNDLVFRPAVSLSFAHSSANIVDGEHRGYRPSDVAANKAKSIGGSSVRYYGGLLNPSLENMSVIRAAAAINPSRLIGVELSYHAYWQNKLTTIRLDSGLTYNPNGEHHFIGQGIDLEASWKPIKGVKFGLSAGVFFSGPANSEQLDPALSASLKASYAF